MRIELHDLARVAERMATRVARVVAGLEAWPMASGALLGDARELERQVAAYFARLEGLVSPLVAAAFTQDELHARLSRPKVVLQAA